MAVVFGHFLRRPITTQYPEERLITSRRSRGNELIWDEVKCTGCATCAKSCPQGAIIIETSVNQQENTYKVEKYEVDNGYCIQCGLCVEACPFQALFLGYTYERAKYRRGELVMRDKELLTSKERPASGYMYPEIAARLPAQSLLVEAEKVKE